MKEAFLEKKLEERKAQDAFRQLKLVSGMVDFCSNDYLGIARMPLSSEVQHLSHGSTGSRLLSGNSLSAEALEKQIARFHEAGAALLFNSGYDANLGLLSSVAQKGDIIFYDQLSHASIRDGIRLSFAQSVGFRHNDMSDLEKKLQLAPPAQKFVVTEGVFSMDGDQAPMEELVRICEAYDALLIIDEAHSLGVLGERGEGLAQASGLHAHCFARVYTYGKAAGAHGAAIVGSGLLRDYLINFSRPFIFTTALPETALHAISEAYRLFPEMNTARIRLNELIRRFQAAPLKYQKLLSNTPIQGILVPGNASVKSLAGKLQGAGMDARAILYPSVPKGGERIRIVLHAYNTMEELERLVQILQ